MVNYVLQLENEPINEDNGIDIIALPDWFRYGIATEWVDKGSEADKNHLLDMLYEKDICDSTGTEEVMFSKTDVYKYFDKKVQFLQKLDTAKKLLESFNAAERELNDKYGLYIYNDEELYTLDEFLRDLCISDEEIERFFIGDILIYKY